MATTIDEIIKESIRELKEEHLKLTPDNYTKIFCGVAKKRGVVTEDCRKLDKYSQRLDESYQKELKRLKVSSMDEFFSFISTRLNRSNIATSEKLVQSLAIMSKRILQATSLLHNKKASNLANASIERLEQRLEVENIELIKNKWFDFITTYDDNFLKKLEIFDINRKDDLEKMSNQIYQALNSIDEAEIYKKIAPLIIATLVPSIASSMNDELAAISSQLRNNPEILSSDSTQRDIKKFIKKRVELDKSEIREKITALDEILNEINQQIVGLIDSNVASSDKVVVIKNDLQSIDLKQDSFEAIREKLITIASSLEFESKDLAEKMKSDQKTISRLYQRVKKLEGALIVAKQESKEDYLTGVATKRALSREIQRVEDGYKRYSTDYSLCFMDLDHFKSINDNYGHEAGDIILSTMGKILRRYTRKVDFVGRYGGEEFLIILPNSDIKKAIAFADKVRAIIGNFKFLHKGERIDITVSCGISQRSQHTDHKATLEQADKMLYAAKNAGRNQVMPKA